MEKKIPIKNLYLLLVISLSLIGLGIGSTYAIFTTNSEINNPISFTTNLSYSSDVLDTAQITVPSGEIITTTLNITNSTNSTLNYITWYVNGGYNVEVICETNSSHGTIESGNNQSILVRVINNDSKSATIALGVSSNTDSVVLGNSMNKVENVNFLMKESKTISDSTATFLSSELQRGKIESITFVDNINVPTGNTSVDVSKYKDGTVLMWYGDTNENGNYDVYIGSDKGKTYLDSGYYLFAYLTNIKSLEFSTNIDSSNVTDMSWMFYNCNKITSLNLEKFNTAKVTTMWNMFQDCSSLTSLDLTSFDTKNVVYMRKMFFGCTNLNSLNVSSFNTENVIDMIQMFLNCENLETLDLSNFNTSKINTMSNMFSGCKKLKSLNLTSFNTENVTDTSYMFYNCNSLETLDLSSFDTSNVTNMTRMFIFCGSLRELNISSWDVSNVTSYERMFTDDVLITNLLVMDAAHVTWFKEKFPNLNVSVYTA